IPESMAGRELSTLKIGTAFDVRLLGLMRGTEYRSCDDTGMVLEEDDKLILLGKRPELRRFGDAF
ncbi:MAG: TrkA C-terminal domain-containing protein, partial [Geminicoccaceae bacterium]|nr:TrkA C-terminal domain-containing protein [Geminicoccaceae bacterium]